MDYFYDKQVRRYITQFMRIFIGFKFEAGDGEQQVVPVVYGDMSRQVANIIKENTENKTEVFENNSTTSIQTESFEETSTEPEKTE